ncbi:Protein of unknown function [[Clostridium] fimetarium]|uniref:DUF4446 domain-containing protein n=2 Tax=[Clostridium] fimetarium TaxID=99656 RepID=A0A1I0QSA5_9FIRM|nr:Protein of unknown function [[Clostridium] fimetarium]
MIDFFGIVSINAEYIILGILGITIGAIILSIVILFKLKELKRKYNLFMNGKDAESLEPLLLKRFEEIEKLTLANTKNTKEITEIFSRLQFVYQKVGIVKYDAFNEMGGRLSFSLAMLDNRNNGYIINSMHSREGCYTYIKEIVNGQSYIDLGDEERQALNQAIAGQGDVDLGDINSKLK